MTAEIATLMVPVDGTHPGDAELQAVGALAAELGVGIIGISASERPPSFYFAAGAVATELIEEDERRMKERMATAEKRFRVALANKGVTLQWRSAVEIPADFIAHEARAADLIVCFLRSEPAPYTGVEAGELVLRSGRPVLAVPEGATWRSPEKALVTWKDSREARRAVRDALPLLTRAKQVRVIEVVEAEESPERADARVSDVVAWLKAHGIAASKQAISPRKGVSEAVDAAAREMDADLIVAGAYGHSRLGEWIFGGVTRHLLIESNRPVFLSH